MPMGRWQRHCRCNPEKEASRILSQSIFGSIIPALGRLACHHPSLLLVPWHVIYEECSCGGRAANLNLGRLICVGCLDSAAARFNRGSSPLKRGRVGADGTKNLFVRHGARQMSASSVLLRLGICRGRHGLIIGLGCGCWITGLTAACHGKYCNARQQVVMLHKAVTPALTGAGPLTSEL